MIKLAKNFGRLWMPSIIAAVSAVCSLLLRSCPAAIVRGVRAVVVWEAIDRMVFGRTRPHIGEEVLKTVTPAIANNDPTAAIFRVILAIDVIAAILHSFPRVILRCFAKAVGSIRLYNVRSADTAARNYPSEMILTNHDLFAANASAEPGTVTRTPTRFFPNNDQIAELLAGQIRSFSHI